MIEQSYRDIRFQADLDIVLSQKTCLNMVVPVSFNLCTVTLHLPLSKADSLEPMNTEKKIICFHITLHSHTERDGLTISSYRPLTSCSECWSTETKRFDVGPIVRNNTDNQHSNLQVSHYHEANAKRCREKSHYLFSMLTSPLKDTGSAINTKMPNRKHKRSPQNNLC